MAEVRREDYRKGRRFKQEIRNPGLEAEARAYMATVSPVVGKGDYQEISTAVKELYNDYGFARLLLLEGTYNGADNMGEPRVDLYSNVEIAGVGSELVTVDFQGIAHGFKAQGATDDFLENIHLKGFKAKGLSATTGYAIWGEYVNLFTVEGVDFEDSDDYDVFLQFIKRGRIDRCKSKNSSGYFYAHALGFEITNNEIVDPVVGRIEGSGGGPVIEKNIIKDPQSDGSSDGVIKVGNTARVFKNEIRDNKGDSTIDRIIEVGIDNNIVIGNKIDGYTYGDFNYGVYVSHNADRNVISGNQVRGCNNAGIYLWDSGSAGGDRNNINGNVVEASGNGCTIAGSNCSKNIVSGNSFEDGFTDNGTATETGGANITS